MKSQEEDFKRVKDALKTAYDDKQKTDLGELADDMWQMKVMRHIRRIGPLKPEPVLMEFVEGWIWKFAPVACILIAILIVCLYNLDLSTEYEMAKLYIDDPIGYSIVKVLGI